MPSNHLFLCYPLLLPAIFPRIRVFSNESSLHIRWPKYWHFSFSLSPSSEYSGFISFRIDSFDLSAVQRTAKKKKKECFPHSNPNLLFSVLFSILLYTIFFPRPFVYSSLASNQKLPTSKSLQAFPLHERLSLIFTLLEKIKKSFKGQH